MIAFNFKNNMKKN